MKPIRPAAVAGTFYTNNPALLRKEVEAFLIPREPVSLPGMVRGLVSPHAGYLYSGATAGAGYSLIKGHSYDTVFIVSPSHREFFNAVSIFPGEAYQTPLGNVPIDTEAREHLISNCSCVIESEAGHRTEHAVEVQLPFLQVALGSFRFVPLVIGNQRRDLCYQLGEALASYARGRNCLFIASSDLSHFHPYDVAQSLDRRVIRAIEAFDEDEFMNQLELEKMEACGGGPIVTVMVAAKLLGCSQAKKIHYCNSGDVTSDKTGVVGYLSAVFSN
ncbi:MAG: AmmeMemoRadiSam system protein B [bacterium]